MWKLEVNVYSKIQNCSIHFFLCFLSYFGHNSYFWFYIVFCTVNVDIFAWPWSLKIEYKVGSCSCYTNKQNISIILSQNIFYKVRNLKKCIKVKKEPYYFEFVICSSFL